VSHSRGASAWRPLYSVLAGSAHYEEPSVPACGQRSGKRMAARTADPDLGHYFLAAGAFRATVRHEPMAIAS